MTKNVVTLLFVSLIAAIPTKSSADPVTREHLNASFAVAVDSLNKMRVFAKACGLSKTGEPVALEFIANFSVRTGISMVKIKESVDTAYTAAPEANTGFKRDCEPKYVDFWTEAFRQRSLELNDLLSHYLGQN